MFAYPLIDPIIYSARLLTVRKGLTDLTDDILRCFGIDSHVSEYIYPRRGGMRGSAYEYELLFDGDTGTDEPQLIGLIDLEKLGYDEKFTGFMSRFAGSKRPQNGAFTESDLAAEPQKNKVARSLPRNRQNAQATKKLEAVVS